MIAFGFFSFLLFLQSFWMRIGNRTKLQLYKMTQLSSSSTHIYNSLAQTDGYSKMKRKKHSTTEYGVLILRQLNTLHVISSVHNTIGCSKTFWAHFVVSITINSHNRECPVRPILSVIYLNCSDSKCALSDAISLFSFRIGIGLRHCRTAFTLAKVLIESFNLQSKSMAAATTASMT